MIIIILLLSMPDIDSAQSIESVTSVMHLLCSMVNVFFIFPINQLRIYINHVYTRQLVDDEDDDRCNTSTQIHTKKKNVPDESLLVKNCGHFSSVC